MDPRLLEISAISKAITKWPLQAENIAQSFSYNQLISKQALCEWIDEDHPSSSVTFLGGWFCTLPPVLFATQHSIVSVDLDPICAEVNMHPNIQYVTSDVADFIPTTEVVVNSSVEHMTYDTLASSFKNMNRAQTIYMMSNNMDHVADHINTHKKMEHFVVQVSKWIDVESTKTISLRKGYERYLIKGYLK
jgi:hypothetical protein